jgi:sortase A
VRRALLALGLSAAAIVGVASVAGTAERDRPTALATAEGIGHEPAARARASTTTTFPLVPVTAPTTTTAVPTVPVPAAAAVALPVPARVPADPRAPEPEVRLGTIDIPRLGLSDTLYEGVSLTSIDRGPSHWPGTAMPGEVGNVVVAGHRVTRTKPFRDIDRLQPGDRVLFTVDGVTHTYEMVAPEIVTPDGMHIVEQTPERTATLFACHPPGSARFRYVVHLRLVA